MQENQNQRKRTAGILIRPDPRVTVTKTPDTGIKNTMEQKTGL